MFGKKDDIKEEMQKAESEAISSIVDQSMRIIGEITFKGKARIDGTIEGNVNGEHLVLSETGKVIGDLAVSSFNCFGTIQGNVTANIIIAKKGCSMNGRLEAGSLTVEPGASIDGEIKAAAPKGTQQPATDSAPSKAAEKN